MSSNPGTLIMTSVDSIHLREGEQPNKPLIIACIPAYNEERAIASVIMRTQKHVDGVIVCDDGSTDMTGEIAERLGAIVLKHPKNLGKGEALRTLFTYALKSNPSVIVALDADAQHDPDEIPKLVKPILNNDADMIIGSRFIDGASTDIPPYRIAGTKIINWLSGKQVKDLQSGFRAFSRKALVTLLECESMGYGVEQEQVALAVKNNLRIVEIPISVRYGGLDKTSKKGPIAHGLDLISNAVSLVVEERPILTLGVPGTMLLITGFGLSTYLVWYFDTTGYFSIPVAMMTLGAILVGTILIIAALILYGLNRVAYKIRRSSAVK